MSKNPQIITFALFFFAFYFPLYADNVNWIRPASDEDFLGRWEGNFSIELPEVSGVRLANAGIDGAISLNYTKIPAAGGIVVMVMSFDMNRLLDSFLNLPEAKITGFTKDVLWGIMLSEMDFDEKLEVDVKRYSINVTQTNTAEEFFLGESSRGDILISEDRTLMKLIFYERLTFGLGDEGISEIILHKL